MGWGEKAIGRHGPTLRGELTIMQFCAGKHVLRLISARQGLFYIGC